LELHGTGFFWVCLGTLSAKVPLPSTTHAHANPATVLRRSPSHSVRRAQRALLVVGDHRVLLWRAMAPSVRHNFGAFRAQVLFNVVQLWRRRKPNWALHSEREGRRTLV